MAIRILSVALLAFSLACDEGSTSAGASPTGEPDVSAQPEPLWLIRSIPLDGAFGVSTRSSIRLEFSKEIDASSLSPAAVIVDVAGELEVDGREVTFRPSTLFPAAELRRVVVSTGLRAVDGSMLEEDTEISFTTSEGEPPFVVGFWPSNDAEFVELDAAPYVDLSEPLDAASIEGAVLRVNATEVPATAALEEGGTRLRLRPAEPLQPGQVYEVVVPGDVRSAARRLLGFRFSWSFESEPNNFDELLTDNCAGAEGERCSDGDPCTFGDRCEGGECVSTRAGDCSLLEGTCAAGVCSADTGACFLRPENEGLSCDDGDACTLGESCGGGACLPKTKRECGASVGDCQVSRCDPSTGECRAEPAREGRPCDDGESCTFADVCSDGVCGGTQSPCPDSECTTNVGCDGRGGCIEEIDAGWCLIEGSCFQEGERSPFSACLECDPQVPDTWTEVPAGTECSRGDFCTIAAVCDEGECLSIQLRACRDLDEACRVGVCLPGDNECTRVDVETGTPCDDGDACTAEDFCDDGECSGTPLDCDDGLDCTTDACSLDSCASLPDPGWRIVGGECLEQEQLELVRIEPQTFTMGSPDGLREYPVGSGEIPVAELGRDGGEMATLVSITRPYLIAAHEVTLAQWWAGGMPTPETVFCEEPACALDGVSMWDAMAWCNARSVSEGLTPCYELVGCRRDEAGGHTVCDSVAPVGGDGALDCPGYRLPTEAEWELAARAGEIGPLYGDLDEVAWWWENSSDGPKAVKQKLPNSWGLFDVLGNVSEWVWGDGRTPLELAVTDPAASAVSVPSAHRGGSWNVSLRAGLRLAQNSSLDPNLRTPGLRPVRSVVESRP